MISPSIRRGSPGPSPEPYVADAVLSRAGQSKATIGMRRLSQAPAKLFPLSTPRFAPIHPRFGAYQARLGIHNPLTMISFTSVILHGISTLGGYPVFSFP